MVALNGRDQAMRRALHDDTARLTDVYTEALDIGRFRGHDLEDAFLGLLRKKYAADTPDVILAGAPFALDFAVRHRTELWPEARIVFYGVPATGAAQQTLVIGGVTDSDQARVRSAIGLCCNWPAMNSTNASADRIPLKHLKASHSERAGGNYAFVNARVRTRRGITCSGRIVRRSTGSARSPLGTHHHALLGRRAGEPDRGSEQGVQAGCPKMPTLVIFKKQAPAAVAASA